MSHLIKRSGLRWCGSGVALAALLLAYRAHAAQEVVPGSFNASVGCDRDPDYKPGDPCTSPATAGDMYLTAFFAFAPTQTEFDYLEEQVTRASQIVCDATDGMVRIRSIQWSTSQAVKEDADVWWYPAATPVGAHSRGLGLAPGSRIVSDLYGARGDVFAHELGHLVFHLHDSYVKPGGFGPSFNGPQRTSADGTAYSMWTEGDGPGDIRYPNLLTIPDAADERRHSIMQQSAGLACIDPTTGLTPFQTNPIHSGGGEGYCWADANALQGQFNGCSPWPAQFSSCTYIPNLMSEISGLNVYDQITNMAGTGFSATDACPPPMETREIVVQSHIGLQDTCATAPCASFHEQGRLEAELNTFRRAGVLQVRDTSLDNATAWHNIPYTWVIQTDETATLLIYHPDYPSELPVAVWDMDFGFHGRVASINGAPVNSFASDGGPSLAIGAGVVSSFMTEDTDGSVGRYEVNSKALLNGAAALEMALDLTKLRLQFNPCVDGDKELRCRPMLYGRHGTIPSGTMITGRDGDPVDVGGEDIPHYDLVTNDQVCRFSYHPVTKRFESPMETHRQLIDILGTHPTDGSLGVGNSTESDPTKIADAQALIQSEWDYVLKYMLDAHGLDMGQRDPRVTNPSDGLPTEAADARCLTKPRDILWPSYAEYEAGLADQIVFVLDRSGSMAQSPNGVTQQKTRLDFVKAGARAFLDMHAGRTEPPDVGIVYFNSVPTSVVSLTTLSATNLEQLKTDHFRDSTDPNEPQPVPPVPQGATNISAALARAVQLHETTALPASAKGIVLLTDGEDTVLGDEAVDTYVAELQKSYQLQSITTGFDSNNLGIAGAIDTLNGFELSTPDPIDLPGAFFEAGAREYGQSLAKHFRTAPDGQEDWGEGGVQDYYLVSVEPGAQELQLLFFAGHGTNPSHVDYVPILTAAASQSANSEVDAAAIGVENPWDPYFTIHDPDSGDDYGEYPITVDDVHYKLVKIPNPQAGQWRIFVAESFISRRAEFAAFVNNPDILCSVSADTSRVATGGPVVFSPSASDGNTLGAGVDFDIQVTGPDDEPKSVDVFYNETMGGYVGYLQPNDFSGRGKYLAVANCGVSSDVKAVEGEPISGAEDRPNFIRPPRSFVREASAAFHLKLDEPAHIPTTGPRADDADMDGILNEDEPDGDFDGDGLEDIYDGDADNDDVPDGIDPDPHDKNVPNPTVCAVEPVSTACCEAIWGCSGSIDWAVYAEGTLDIRNGARIETPDGDAAPVANAGGIQTTLGVDASAGNIESKANIQLNERAHVEGHARTTGTIGEQNSVVVDDGRLPNATIELPSLSTFAVAFPPAGVDVALEPDTAHTLAPGSYGNLSVKSRSKLYLGSGVYYFNELNVNEPDAEIITVSPSGAPTYIYVKNNFIQRGAFRDLDGKKDTLFIGYLGTNDAHIETPFVGTFVAPKATVYLKPLNGLGHTGHFLARM